MVTDSTTASTMARAYALTEFARPRTFLLYLFFAGVLVLFALLWDLAVPVRVALIVLAVVVLVGSPIAVYALQRAFYARMFPPGTTIRTRYARGRMLMSHPRGESDVPFITYDRIRRVGGCVVMRVAGSSALLVVVAELVPDSAFVLIRDAIRAAP